MKTVRLGANGPEISQLGFGAMSFAGIYGNATEEESFSVLDTLRAVYQRRRAESTAIGDRHA